MTRKLLPVPPLQTWAIMAWAHDVDEAMIVARDHVMAPSLHPQSARQTKVLMRWYVHEDAQPGRDYDPDRLCAFWDITNRQDIHLCNLNQQGVNSRRYTPGPYSLRDEPDNEHFIRFYITLMARSLGQP